MEVGQFKIFMNMLTKLHVNISLCEALEQISSYAKFIKEILLRKRKLKYNENIALAEECNTIIQRKLPPKLTMLGENME